MAEIKYKIECPPEVEVIAKALHTHTYYAGRHLYPVVWPPERPANLKGLLNKAEAIWAALKEYEQGKTQASN